MVWLTVLISLLGLVGNSSCLDCPVGYLVVEQCQKASGDINNVNNNGNGVNKQLPAKPLDVLNAYRNKHHVAKLAWSDELQREASR